MSTPYSRSLKANAKWHGVLPGLSAANVNIAHEACYSTSRGCREGGADAFFRRSKTELNRYTQRSIDSTLTSIYLST